MIIACGFVVMLSICSPSPFLDETHFQAHRGGLKEVPENTMAAYRYAWDLSAIPEVDITMTLDKVIICLHDNTLKRTTNARSNAEIPVSELTFNEIRQWDAGGWFDPQYAGEKVPALEEVLSEMAIRDEAQIYLDLKEVDLDTLAALIAKYDVAPRVIFCHNTVEACRTMRAAVPGLRTMLWIGGEVNEIQAKFRKAAEDGFNGLDQVQLHLKAGPDNNRIDYLMSKDFLHEALQVTSAEQVDLEVLPFEFDCESLARLLDLGIRWFATDEPKRFKACLENYFATARKIEPLELALQPAPVIAPPGPEYADNQRLFQGIPGLERAANGRLWATWYGGGDGEGPDNYVMLATSGDDGATWSGVNLVIDPPGVVRAFDPCLWHDPQGKLWLFWAQGVTLWDGRSGVWAITTDDSGSASPEWTAPRRLCDGIMMNKPTVRRDGAWLLPVAIWVMPAIRPPGPEYVIDHSETTGSWVVISEDGGSTFRMLGRSDVEGRQCDEHIIVERKDGSLWMLVRTNYGLGESFSTDGGMTWSEGRPAETVTHIDSAARFFLRRLASGNLLFVKHAPPGNKGRSHLTAFLSEDDGKTWTNGLLLDARKGVSYPDGVESPDGRIYIVYDYSRTGDREILMAVFIEADLRTGEMVSQQARHRVLINKASGK